jgi:hypothetical protein
MILINTILHTTIKVTLSMIIITVTFHNLRYVLFISNLSFILILSSLFYMTSSIIIILSYEVICQLIINPYLLMLCGSLFIIVMTTLLNTLIVSIWIDMSSIDTIIFLLTLLSCKILYDRFLSFLLVSYKV